MTREALPRDRQYFHQLKQCCEHARLFLISILASSIEKQIRSTVFTTNLELLRDNPGLVM